MSRATEFARASFEGQDVVNIHNRRMFGNQRTFTRDREEMHNDRVNHLYVRYSERLNILRARIACLMSGEISQSKHVMELAARCCELRMKRESILQGILPKRKYKLLKVS